MRNALVLFRSKKIRQLLTGGLNVMKSVLQLFLYAEFLQFSFCIFYQFHDVNTVG